MTTMKAFTTATVHDAAPLHDYEPARPGDDWTPGFWNNFPRAGLLSIIGIFLCMTGSVLVLIFSNGTPEQHWQPRQVTPSVWLSGFNNISNICFGIAIAHGCAIAWWRRLLKGDQIGRLHKSWTFSSSFTNALFAGKSFNIIALAALTAKFTIIDGMLMQKATNLELMEDEPVSLILNIGSAGIINETIPVTGVKGRNANGTATALTQSFNDALKFWSSSGPLLADGFGGCNGYCFFNLPAAGFEIHCTEVSAEPINYALTLQQMEHSSSSSSQRTLFDISFTPVDSLGDPDSHDEVTTYSYIQAEFIYTRANDTTANGTGSSCPGTRYHRSCQLRPAVLSYPVMVQTSKGNDILNAARVGITEESYNESGIDFMSPKAYDTDLKQVGGYTVLRYQDIYEHIHDAGDTQLGGIVMGLQMYLGGSASLELDGDTGLPALKQLGNSPQFLTNSVNLEGCGYQYYDPFEDFWQWNIPSVPERINEIMFTLASDMTSDALLNSSAADFETFEHQWYNSTQYSFTIHYKTDYAYMVGALASTFLCVLCVVPTYWGFWELGRKLALSPLEIAAAFGSPLVRSGKDVDGIIKEHGEKTVRFGRIFQGDGAGRIGVAEALHIQETYE